jgi:adenosylcobinamide kinase / adenosylcobinamide-phosphate guanylyltransferase
MPFTLLVGGARSGKSTLSVRLGAAFDGQVVVIVTAEPRDDEMAERIRWHREQRPAEWTTVEAPTGIADAIRAAPAEAFVVLDCLTLWVSNAIEAGLGDDGVVAEARTAVAALAERAAPGVVVSNEVGMGIVPVNDLARRYRDTLGRVNAVFAERAERALLVVAGRVIPLEELTSA